MGIAVHCHPPFIGFRSPIHILKLCLFNSIHPKRYTSGPTRLIRIHTSCTWRSSGVPCAPVPFPEPLVFYFCNPFYLVHLRSSVYFFVFLLQVSDLYPFRNVFFCLGIAPPLDPFVNPSISLPAAVILQSNGTVLSCKFHGK